MKLDPSGEVLSAFIDLNNRVLERFTATERQQIGVHTCPGGDHDSTHSADVDYLGLLPSLFRLNVGRFYIQLASEPDRRRVLASIRSLLKPGQLLFVGVTDPIDPKVENPEEVRDRVLEAAELIPIEALGTTDDCGFSPFSRDVKPQHGSPDFARDVAMKKITARLEGVRLASAQLGGKLAHA